MSFFKQYFPGILILLVFIISGITLYQDYGASMDEMTQNYIGKVSYDYIFKGDTTLNSYIERDHGTGFELPLMAIQQTLHKTDWTDIILLRHIATHLFFLLCMFSGYVLTYRIFKNQLIACSAFIMLVLDPRLYAHSYLNSKDIPSAGVCMLILSATAWAFEKKRLIPYAILGVVCGYAVSIRLMNLIYVMPILSYILWDIAANRKNNSQVISLSTSLLLLIACFSLTLYTFWPTLWGHPIKSLIESFESMSRFRWEGNVFLGGLTYEAQKLPWHYIPSWFLITIPTFWIFLGFTGIIFFITQCLKDPTQLLKSPLNRNLLLWLFCFLTPVLIVITLHAVVYDDWRHVYSIYPPFILLGAYGFSELLKTKLSIIYKVLWGMQLVFVCSFMFKYHPYEAVYFNGLVSHKKNDLLKNYELDYWGSSNKDALEWILEHSADDTIKINNNNWILWFNSQVLTPDKRKRFVVTDNPSEIEYYIENFRTVPYKYPETCDSIVHQIMVLNSPIIRITRFKK
ncbi:MAG: glycosyltransferase family 39 protein [Bacteroidetes bacterium]|nr:glycosyltransferase family 39 protein [Bacteroidota bacterium]